MTNGTWRSTRRPIRTLAISLSAGTLVLAGCSSESAGNDSNEVVELSALPGDHIIAGPLYAADDQGLYDEQGLDYKLEFPGSTVRAIQSLVGGDVGIAWTDAFGVLSAKQQGFDLVSVYNTYRGSGFAFAVADDSPISEWDADQLRGKTFGITAFDGGEVPILRAALARLGLPKEGTDYNLEVVGEGGSETAEAVESGKVDVVTGSYLDLMALEDRGVAIRMITPDYLRTEFPGHAYAVTPEQLESNREEVVKFLRAHAEALVMLQANPTCVAKVAMEHAPESVGDLDVQGVADFLIGFWIGNNEAYFDKASPLYHRLGAQDPQGWSDYQDFLIEAGVEGEDGGVLTEPLDIDEVVDDSLIDDVNDFDYDAVAQEAKDWKC